MITLLILMIYADVFVVFDVNFVRKDCFQFGILVLAIYLCHFERVLLINMSMNGRLELPRAGLMVAGYA